MGFNSGFKGLNCIALILFWYNYQCSVTNKVQTSDSMEILHTQHVNVMLERDEVTQSRTQHHIFIIF